MEKKPMNVAISLNQKYFYYTYVMLTSLYQNNPESAITTYILHSELNKEQLDSYQALAERFGGGICSIWIDRKDFSEQLPTTTAWSIEAYYRLVMPDILPEKVDRILYIDVDTIVNASLRELYETDFEGKFFCVCKDGPANDEDNAQRKARKVIFNPLFDQGFVYFNSGVMLWNLERVREEYHFQDYMQIAAEMGYHFVSPDQDILNYCHWNQVKYVDETIYNQFARIAHNMGKKYEEVKKEVCILHYAGTKPWNADNIHFDLEKIWWDYAKLTPYYEKLSTEFIHKTMTDKTMEEYVHNLFTQIEALQSNLSDSLALNERLFSMLPQRE